MKVHNVRFGFATNSSASHSIIFMPEGELPRSQVVDDYYYGGGDFALVTESDKRAYLAVNLYLQLAYLVGEESAGTIAGAWSGIQEELLREGGVDHQAKIIFPYHLLADMYDATKVKMPDKQFFTEFTEFVANDPRIVILGGSDNDEIVFSRSFDGVRIGSELMKRMLGRTNVICRKDSSGVWTLMDQDCGNRVRFTLSTPPENPRKGNTPELVDLKITDQCTYGCSYCYQGSGPRGKHGEVNRGLVGVLSDLGVLEVAIGGGDPVLHPRVVELCREMRGCRIVPNLTTRSVNRLLENDARLLNDLSKYIGGLAISVDDISQMEGVRKIYDTGKVRRLSVHVVVGVIPLEQLRELIHGYTDDMHLVITLLGYKSLGRGESFTPAYGAAEVAGMLKEFKEGGKYVSPVSIDTTLAAEILDTLKEMRIPEYMYSVREGETSMYIDLVDKKFGPSSFCAPEEMVPFGQFAMTEYDQVPEPQMYEKIVKLFPTW